MKRFLLSLLCVLSAVYGMAYLPPGALPGGFTVNSYSDKVYFSQGDLMYQPSTGTWRFMEPYETREIDNMVYIGRKTTDKWLDLFGWGTSGYADPSGRENAMPTEVHQDNAYYGPSNGDLTGENAEYDWAWHNRIQNGGNQAHVWRTLSQEEWNYIINSRPNYTERRFWVALEYQNTTIRLGLMLLPDNWDKTALFNYETSAAATNPQNYVVMSLDQITTIIRAGGVLLNAVGKRTRYEMENANRIIYWSRSRCLDDDDMAQCIFWYNECTGGDDTDCVLYSEGTTFRSSGARVRPVVDQATVYTYHSADAISAEFHYLIESGEGLDECNIRLRTMDGKDIEHSEDVYYEQAGNKRFYLHLNGEQDMYCDFVELEYLDDNTRDTVWVGKHTADWSEITLPITRDCQIIIHIAQYNYYCVRSIVNDAEMGYVDSEEKNIREGDETNVMADPNNGYEFVNWSYEGTMKISGDWEEMRTKKKIVFEPTSDLTLIANFAPPPPVYTVTVAKNYDNWGTVSGGGSVEAGQTVTLTATPNSGYQFIGWQTDEDEWIYRYSFERTVYKDETITAHFRQVPDYQVYPLTVCGEKVTQINQSNIMNGAMRYDPENNRLTILRRLYISDLTTPFVSYTGSQELTIAIDSAVNIDYTGSDYPIYSFAGIRFEAEKTGSYLRDFSFTSTGASPIYVQGELSFVGRLRAGIYSKGTASKRYNMICGNLTKVNVSQAEVTMSDMGTPQKNVSSMTNAILNLNHSEVFSGALNQSSIFIISTELWYEVSYTDARPEDEWLDICPVIGMGSYLSNSYANLKAVPQEGYDFVSWSDGVTENPRQIWVEEANYYIDPVYVATHNEGAFISANVSNPAGGSIPNFQSGWFAKGISLTLNVQVNEGYQFVGWSDGNTDNPRYITVEDGNNLNLTAKIMDYSNWITPEEGIVRYCVIVKANNDEYGTVSGAEQEWYAEGESVTLNAKATEGCYFIRWKDGSTVNPRTITVGTEDILMIAEFKKPDEGIEQAESQEPRGKSQKVLRNGVLYIERNGRIYDAQGAEVEIKN